MAQEKDREPLPEELENVDPLSLEAEEDEGEIEAEELDEPGWD